MNSSDSNLLRAILHKLTFPSSIAEVSPLLVKLLRSSVQ